MSCGTTTPGVAGSQLGGYLAQDVERRSLLYNYQNQLLAECRTRASSTECESVSIGGADAPRFASSP